MNETRMKKRILLVDDHRMMRQGLKTLLEREPDMEVVGEAANGRRGLELAEELTPDVVVTDISMPALNGIEATRQLARIEPAPRVVVLSMRGDARSVEQALTAGASAYVIKDS